EGVTLHYGADVGGNAPGAIDPRELLNQYDALALTGGAEAPRDLPIPGRDLDGIHFAMDFLPQQNRRVSNEPLGDAPDILAGGKPPGAIEPRELLTQYAARALTGGAEAPRDLPIPGRDLDGIHFAMDFLPQQNRRVSNEPLGDAPDILAGGKHVVVIGGGDTG